MAAAQDADDPLAIAAAARFYGVVYRWAGQIERASSVVREAAALLDPGADVEQRARWGVLRLSLALSEAKAGRAGDAWRAWDQAKLAADALGAGYCHPWLIVFGPAAVDGHAMRIDNFLFQPGRALRRADIFDVTRLPSPTWRAPRLIDMAQAHSLRREHVAAIHLIAKAYRESPETAKYDLFVRQTLLDLSERRTSVRDDARELAATLGIPL
jgi:hypothetical protein